MFKFTRNILVWQTPNNICLYLVFYCALHSFYYFSFFCYPITFQVPIPYIHSIYITAMSCRCSKVFVVLLLICCLDFLYFFVTLCTIYSIFSDAHSKLELNNGIFCTSNIRSELGLRLFLSFYCKSVSILLVILCYNPKWL